MYLNQVVSSFRQSEYGISHVPIFSGRFSIFSNNVENTAFQTMQSLLSGKEYCIIKLYYKIILQNYKIIHHSERLKLARQSVFKQFQQKPNIFFVFR